MRLCDVTLREATQMPGREYTVEQTIAAGKALDALSLSLIQAGFPATGNHDATVTQRLAETLETDVGAIARARDADVDAALDADADVIEVFVPVSDRQLQAVLGASRQEAFESASEAIDRVRDGDARPHLTLLDAFRTDAGDIAPAFDRFDVPITLADTVGARTPSFVAGYLRSLAELDVSLDRVGVHFHDDLGVATANALVATRLGVDRVDVSVASLGERAGNPALEEVAVALETAGHETGLAREQLIPTCRTVLDALDESVDPRTPIIGEAVTAHESGLHTTAMLDDPATFEPYDPETFGGKRRLLFGAHTGRGGAERLLEQADRNPTEERTDALLDRLTESEAPVELDEAVAMAEQL
ncbi:LeuA family protein [Halocatena pleomorpha]|uniref:Citramalate synthase n=1 Tax=Halocatena pleomorpha TaxID=1785090 RepID=A0A3P3R862_9EURY|nr:LeuA family protein [Halocatena pleomorpha]RRJ29228.1 citramalate synthase [Halocatena pleomorpha]